MNKFFKSRMMQSIFPYFILALMVIVVFRVTAEFRFFTDTVGRFWSIISPFLTGAVIAYILNLPCSAIQRLIKRTKQPFVMRYSRGISVLLLAIITVFIITLILNILIPAVTNSSRQFMAEMGNYEATIRSWINSLNEMDLPEAITYHINEDAIIAAILGWVATIDAGGIMDGIVAGFGGLALALFHTFLAIVSSIYLLVEKDRLKAFAVKLISAVTTKTTNATILKYSRKLDHNFHQYIYTQTIDGLILGTIMTITLYLFGSDYFLVLGLILGILNYIPYFGSIVGTALAVLVVAFTQGLWPTAVIAAIVMFAIQQFDGNFIQPKLMGGTFSLSPLLVIISVTVGMHYGGVLGMLVAIPIVAVLKDILDSYIAYREELKINPPIEDDFMNRDVW